MNKIISQKFLLFLSLFLIIGMIIWKGMLFWEEPRLWAEEGSVYLKSAFEEGWKAMFMPQVGYYSIIPSVSTYLSTLLPMQYIPTFTQGISFLFWIIPFLLIVGLNKNIFTDFGKIFSMFSLIFIFFSQEEVFLNTINLQFITPTILLISTFYDEDKLSKYEVFGLRFLQMICLLNGVLGLLLIPYLMYKALIIDKKYDLLGLYIIAIIIHLLMFLGYNGDGDAVHRVKGNINFFIQDFEKSILRVVANRKVYIVLFVLGILTFISLWKEGRKEGRRPFCFLLVVGYLFFL